MAQYAQQHATQSYVRDLAQSMINGAEREIVQMEQMLRRPRRHSAAAAPTG